MIRLSSFLLNEITPCKNLTRICTRVLSPDRKGSVQAKLKEDHKASFPIQELMKSEWETIAYFSKDGEVICQRESYGSPMIALKPELFKQGAYSKMVEESFKSFRTGREILVPEMSEATASSIVKEFNEWKQKEKSE